MGWILGDNGWDSNGNGSCNVTIESSDDYDVRTRVAV